MPRFALAALLVGWFASSSSAQDWRTSGEDPCGCTDSMPFIIGPRPSVTTPAQIAQVVSDSRSDSCRVARLAVEAPPRLLVRRAYAFGTIGLMAGIGLFALIVYAMLS